MKGSRKLLVTAAVAVGLFALAVGFHALLPRLLAAYWRGRLDSVPDARAGVMLDRVAKLGQPGILVLVEALGSPRECVARAGKKALLTEVAHWQTLPVPDASPNMALLADALARQIHNFGPTARADAAELATRILQQPLDPHVIDRGRVTSSCETVLRAASLHRRVRIEANPLARLEPLPLGAGPERTAAARHGPNRRQFGDSSPVSPLATLPHSPLATLPHSPGGELPVELFPGAAGPPSDMADRRAADGRLEQPRWFSGPPGARPIELPHRPRRLPKTSDSAAKPLDGSRDKQPPEQQPIRPLAHRSREAADRAEVAPAGRVEFDAASVETLRQMRRLLSDDEQAAAEAKAELQRLGFADVHLELARQLLDPDPQVRKRLARLLPRLRSVNPEPWLLWLSRDASAEVRLAAISLLATTNDPALLDKVEQIAQADSDPRIQRQARQIAGRRGGKTH